MCCEKIDKGFVEEMVKKNAVKKEEGQEEKEDEINFLSFMEIVVLWLNESQHDKEVFNAYEELESNAFACADGIDENEIRFLLSKLDPKLTPKDVKKFLEYN